MLRFTSVHFPPKADVATARKLCSCGSMRKLTSRDWLALSVPAVLIFIATAVLWQQRGWIVGVVWFATATAFIIWQWIGRIKSHPENTWRLAFENASDFHPLRMPHARPPDCPR